MRRPRLVRDRSAVVERVVVAAFGAGLVLHDDGFDYAAGESWRFLRARE